MGGTAQQQVQILRIELNRLINTLERFLVGFPRSGTTLLDTMLMGHPGIEVLEEEPTLLEAFHILQDHDALPLVSFVRNPLATPPANCARDPAIIISNTLTWIPSA